jgi:hypothetical protein
MPSILTAGAALMAFSLPLATQAQGIPNEDLFYIHNQLPQDADNFCRAVKGMANFHKVNRSVGVSSPSYPGTEDWCRSMFVDHPEKIESNITSTFQRNHDIHGHNVNTNPSYGGVATSDALLAIQPQGRILVCELFWKWGAEPQSIFSVISGALGSCNIAEAVITGSHD